MLTDSMQFRENLKKQRAWRGAGRVAAVVLRRAGHAKWCILGLLLLWILSTPIALLSISFYQQYLSPHKGWRCAYAALHGGPSCSEYAKEEMSRHGVLWGTLLLRNRFGDCREAAVVLAANPASGQAGKECADGCVRGCCNGPPQVTPPPQPVRPRPKPRPRPPAASITVVSPNKWAIYDSTGTYAENLKVVTITWKSTGVSGNVNIDVSRNRLTNVNPRQWERILSDVPNTGQAQWTPTGPATPFARVRVQSDERPTVAGVSGHDFCIYGPYYKGCPGGFCTEYAAREFDKVSSGADWTMGNAGTWFDEAAARNWDVTTDPTKGVTGAIMVWTFGKYGHVAILRGYQRDTTSEILSSYPQDAKGTIVAVFDEQNAGKMIDDPITNRFGLVTRRQLPASNFNRNSLEFKGLILPRPVRPKLSIGTDSKTFTIGTDATMPVVTATVSSIPPVDLSGTTFDWTATIVFPKNLGTNAIRDTGPDTFAKHAVQGPKARFSGTDWQGKVRGGQLTFTVTATIRGESVTATLDGLSIKGAKSIEGRGAKLHQ